MGNMMQHDGRDCSADAAVAEPWVAARMQELLYRCNSGSGRAMGYMM